jgi:FG-GAP-like repeat
MDSRAFHSAVVGFLSPLILAGPSAVNAQQPRAPRGVYATIDILDYITQNGLPLIPMPGQDAPLVAFYDTMLANPAISGLHIELHWDLGQPNPPPAALNLLYVEDAFTEAAKYGKTIILDVTAGFNSPQWLLNATTNPTTALPPCDNLFVKGETTPMNCGTVTFNYYGEKTDQDTKNQADQMLILPLPWNSTYLGDWQAFLTQLQQQYGSNSVLVGVTMAGPTAASPEMIMPNNYNTCADSVGGNPPANQGAHNLCYTCPVNLSPPCNASNGMLAELMWNTLFTSPNSDQGTPNPQNSDQAFVEPWISTIKFYEGIFQGITLMITPGAGTGFPSFESGYPLTPTAGNVLYDPECNYSNSGGTTYASNSYVTLSCDASTYLLSYFMGTAGGPGPMVDGMASQTGGMEAQDPTALGIVGDGDTGDVGVPGVKYLAAYSLSAGSPQQQVIGGAQFDHQFSAPAFTAEEGCPQGKNGCPGITPEQAEYNVLQVFFLGTPGAIRFGGPANVGIVPGPTPRYLEVLNQDITYAATGTAQPIVDVMTGATYQLSAQDMFNMAQASLFGRLPTHDFSDDGRSDILWRSNGGAIALWLLAGGQIEKTGGLGTASSAWGIVGQRDFDGDGYADILWRDSGGDLSIWLMNGTTVLSEVGVGNVPTNWSVYGTGDLNSDGKGDLLWRDSAGDVAVWFMNGGFAASTASLGNVATNWTIVGDDNQGDIFWRDNVGDYAVWRMNGSQIVASVGLGNIPSNWQIAGLGDFNADGNTDILWRDTAGDVAIWFLNSSFAVQSTASLGNISPTTWTIAQTGDYNADGYSDILWIDTSGDVSVWFMNGASVGSSAGLANVGTTWTVQAQNAE